MIKLKLITILLTLLLSVNSNAAFDVKARTAILLDYLSGEILFEKDADKSIYPASMTKIMTAIIAFDLIRSGDLNLDEKFSYEIKIADFYFNTTASLLVDRIIKETTIKDAKIKKVNEKKYRVYAGPFNNINSLQKSFNDISILDFENIEIIKND